MKFDIICVSIIFFMLLTTPIILPTSASNIEKTNLVYNYYNYQNMTSLLQNLQSQYLKIMKLESYGKTHEGRDIWFVKISDNVETEEEDEPGILLLGGHHGDEKIGFEILIFFIKYILENYTSEDRVRQAIDNTEIYMIPMINPDGVEANTRKNCNPDSYTGVNTNRNFGYDWKYYDLFPNIYGKSWASKETSGNYRGPVPNSETEVQAIIRVAKSFTLNISLSYHAGAEVVFYPWYHTTKKTPHEELFITIGEEMGKISGYPLWTGSNPLIPRLGGTLGSSENYLYGEHKILAYTVESAKQKAPTNPNSVYNYCYTNVGVHLYLCEKAQTIDNTKEYTSKSFAYIFPNIFSIVHKIFLKLE